MANVPDNLHYSKDHEWVRVDGDTAVIGGIYEEVINNDVTKVPFLGDLPILGYLFKTTDKTIEKQELLIFLTPRVLKDSVTAVR